MAGNLALVVGIDRYQTSPLPSCVRDATTIGELLERDDTDGKPKRYDVRELLGDRDDVEDLTRDGLRRRLAELVTSVGKNDFVFYFSGHGRKTPFGPELVTQDGGGIGMDEVIGLIERSDVKQAVIILDCCFSAGLGNSQVLQPGGRAWSSFDRAVVRENFAILAASGAEESALAGVELSAFTELIVEGLRGGAADAAGEIHAPALFEYAAPVFRADEQGPVFKGHYNSLSPLRKVRPQPPLQVIRSLKKVFPSGTTEITLGPECLDGADTSAQEQYRRIRKLRRFGLVDVGDDCDLAEHAAASSEVRLTPLGMRYRRLALADRL